MIDLLHQKAYVYEPGTSGKFSEAEIPADLAEDAAKGREWLVERICETDDDLTMLYLEGEEIANEDLDRRAQEGGVVGADRAGAGHCGPGECGCVATARLPGSVCAVSRRRGRDKATNPATSAPVTLQPNDASPLSALVFKTIRDQFGKQSYLRVFSGTFRSDSHVLNSTRNIRRAHRPGVCDARQGADRYPAACPRRHRGGGEARRYPHWRHPLRARQPLALDPIKFPEPLFSASIAPKTKADLDKMGTALNNIMEEDATLRTGKDPASGQTILLGYGREPCQIAADRMKRKFGVDVAVGLPVVPYRETITARVNRAHYRHKKQTGGHGQFADVVLELEPLSGGDFEFGERMVGGVVPKNYIPAVEKGIRETLHEGVLAGYPVVSVRAVLYDGGLPPRR